MSVAASLARASGPVRAVLERALEGREVSRAEGALLFEAAGADVAAVAAVADAIRRRAVGDRVGFVVNRNVNFTNVCYMGCRFCGFAKRREDPGAEWLDTSQVVARAREAVARGASEVCIQGGLHPKMPAGHYAGIVRALKAALPALHVHAFSPFEIWYGARKARTSYRAVLEELRDAGLGSIPGTAAEILDTEVRARLTQDKLSADAWCEIVRTAHDVGLPSTATIMYGHVDGPAHWAAHLCLLRDIQKDTGGFTEIVPLSFVHEASPLWLADPSGVRPGPTEREVTLMHAVARILLAGWIDHVQVSWTKLGPARARAMLACGADDLGGTLMNESISRAAGAAHGQEVTAREMVRLIRSAGRVPVRRSTLHDVLETYEGGGEPAAQAPLVARAADPLAFLAPSGGAAPEDVRARADAPAGATPAGAG